jgi:hypothetical protein
MSIGGHIKLHRELLKHPLTLQLPAAWFRIWVVILLRASWKGSRWWDGSKEIDIPAGSFVTSLSQLGKASGASIRQIRSFLNYAEMTQMVTRSVTYHHTMITVTNWRTYQDSRLGDDTPRDTIEVIPRASRGQQYKKEERIKEESSVVEEPVPTNAKLPDWSVV